MTKYARGEMGGNTEPRRVENYGMKIDEGEIDQEGINVERGRARVNVERDNTINRNEDNREHKDEHKEELTWAKVMGGKRDDKEDHSRTNRRVEANEDGRQGGSYRESFGEEIYAGTVGGTQFTVYTGDERSRMGTKRKEEDELSRRVDSHRTETQGRKPLGATENRMKPLRTEERQYVANRDKYERMREMRQRDNEERTRRMKEETRERERELDPTDMRKRDRSSSRGRDRKDRGVKFKPEKVRTKIAIISDSQMKYVTLDEGLEELWVRKGWGSSVAIMRGMNARHIRELAT